MLLHELASSCITFLGLGLFDTKMVINIANAFLAFGKDSLKIHAEVLYLRATHIKYSCLFVFIILKSPK